jgi:hypothetical protein
MKPEDYYLSKPVRRLRAASVVTTWAIASAFVVGAFFFKRSLWSLLFVVSVVPYLISIRYLEPWLMRRLARSGASESRAGVTPN